MAATPLSLKARALQWLAQREHSRVELRRKLLRLANQRTRGETPRSPDGTDVEAEAADPAPEVDALLDWLVAARFLSEARFIESRINARAGRYGNLRIRQELRQHATVLDAAAAERLNASELARARAVWARKYAAQVAVSAPDRARQMRFLAGRGFSADVIRQVVRGGSNEPDEV